MVCAKLSQHVICVFHSFPSTVLANHNQSSSTCAPGSSTTTPSASVTTSLSSVSNTAASSSFVELKSSSGNRKARVLYDYDAANSSELSLLADEVCFFLPQAASQRKNWMFQKLNLHDSQAASSTGASKGMNVSSQLSFTVKLCTISQDCSSKGKGLSRNCINFWCVFKTFIFYIVCLKTW